MADRDARGFREALALATGERVAGLLASAVERGASQLPSSRTLTRRWGLSFTMNVWTAGLPATIGESTSASKSSATKLCGPSPDGIPEIAAVEGIDVLFIGASDLAQSMGYPGQPAHASVQAVVERGVKRICDAGLVAGVSCPNALVPKFLGLGVRYFHSNVAGLICSAGQAYLSEMRQHAAG